MSKNKNLAGGLFMKQPTPLTQTETSISAQIAEHLESRRIYNDRLNAGRIETKFGNWITLCKPGTPDRFCIIRGQIVFIEVKKPGGKLSPEQIKRHEELISHGAAVITANSFDTFINQFSAIRQQIESGETLYK